MVFRRFLQVVHSLYVDSLQRRVGFQVSPFWATPGWFLVQTFDVWLANGYA